MARPRPAVILCGPFPEGGALGGYARCNDLTATSFLNERYGVERLSITVPGDGSALVRLREDMRRTHETLRRVEAPVFHLTSQYLRGTYREYLQFRAAKSAGRAFIFDIRAGDFIPNYEDPKAPLRRRLLRAMILGADAITVEGMPYLRWLEERFGREAMWFPNFVQCGHREQFVAAPLAPPAEGAPVRAGYSGRLVALKGLEASIDAVALLAERGVDMQLTFIGDGEADYRASLEERARERGVSERVVLTGRLSHHDVLRTLAEQHMFLFASEWPGEGHANAVNEALQTGLPVISTRQGFLGDVVTPECGRILDAPEASRIADAVVSLTKDWGQLQACGRAARDRVYGEFGDERVLERLAEVYERFL